MPDQDPKTESLEETDRVSKTELGRGAAAELQPGERVGRYRIIQQIGEGGFATVYQAEQKEPVRRVVALKIIKFGMDTKQIIARFEVERQALAMMDHPNVARVYDAGMTDTGRPYFVMEYVPGEPITDYCDRNRLTTNERLELLMKTCEAVQHAHQNGIIHRDLKPTNVLVWAEGRHPSLKVIDFGVAKAIKHRLTEKTLFTELGQLIGTPAYMSPEQAEQSGLVDTRTDIYSLGVLLYELLVGALPFDKAALREAALGEIQRIIREEEPPKPSTRLSTLGEDTSLLAQKRHSDAKSLARELRGDLDWITMTALEKDRTRRYPTALELSADIRRHLNHEPIVARAPSVQYRVGKFVRRHRLGAAAGALVALALVLGTVGTSIGMFRATRAEAKAQREADIAQAINSFLVEMLSSADPGKEGREVKVANVLTTAAAKMDLAFSGQPKVEAAVRDTIGATFFSLGLYEEAEEQLQSAAEIHRRVLGPDDINTLESFNSLAVVLKNQGKISDAEKLYRSTLATLRRVMGNEDRVTLSTMANLAVLLRRRGELDEAEELHREALVTRRRVLGVEDAQTLSSMANLAALLWDQGRLGDQGKLEEAEQLARETLEARERLLKEDHPETLQSMHILAFILVSQGKLSEAEPLCRRTLKTARRVLGDVHPHTLSSLYGLAFTLLEQDQLPEAEDLAIECYEGNSKVRGPEHTETMKAIKLLVKLYATWGKPSDADKWRRLLPAGIRQPGP